MASALESQLQRIATAAGIGGAQTGSQTVKKGKPSLKYTFIEASDIGVQDIFEEAVRGYEQLCRLEPRFQSFDIKKLLFSRESLSFDPLQETKESLQGIDASVESFCKLLGPYFLLPAATNSLEYLVRKFMVHESHVNSLMKAALPYHETSEFVRCVQIMHLEGTPFEFLGPMKKSGVPLKRDLLVQRCLTDASLLRFICDMSKDLSDPRTGSRNCMGWYAATLCEVIAAKTNIGEDFMAFLMPYLLYGTTRNVVHEYKDATFMILAQLSNRTTLGQTVLQGIVQNLATSASPGNLSRVLLLLSFMTVSQEGFDSISDMSFESLARIPNFITELSLITQKMPQARKFGCIVAYCAAKKGVEQDDYIDLLEQIVELIDINPHHDDFVQHIFNYISKMDLDKLANIEGQMARVVQVVQSVDRHYGEAMELVINSFLAKHDKESKERRVIMKVLERALENSVRAPLIDANVTLAAGVDDASAGVRIMALEKLDAIVKTKENSSREDFELILKSALPRRLEDDDLEVVNTVIHMESLPLVPADILKESLIRCLDRCIKIISAFKSSKREKNTARRTAKSAIAMVASECSDNHSKLAFLLGFLLTSKPLRKVSLIAMKCLCDIQCSLAIQVKASRIHKLLEELQNLKRTDHGGDDSFSAEKYNKEVLDVFSTALLKNVQAQSELLRVLKDPTSHPYSICFVILVLKHSVQKNNKKVKPGAGLVREVLQWFNTDFEQANIMQIDENEDLVLKDIAARHLSPTSVVPAFMEVLLGAMSKSIVQVNSIPYKELVIKLCRLDQSVWGIHLDLLLKKVPNPVILLSQVWAPVAGIESPDDSLVSTAVVSWARVSGSNISANEKSEIARKLINLLCMMSHPKPEVRKATLDAIKVLEDNINNWWPEEAGDVNLSQDLVLEIFETCLHNGISILAELDGIENALYQALTGTTIASSKIRHGKNKTLKQSKRIISETGSEALATYFIKELERLDGEAGIVCIPFLVRLLHDTKTSIGLQAAAASLIERLFIAKNGSCVDLSNGIQRSAVIELLSVLSDPTIERASGGAHKRIYFVVGAMSHWDNEPMIRRQALASMPIWIRTTSNPSELQSMYKILIDAAAKESDSKCREAAHEALETLPVDSKILIPYLSLSPSSGSRKKSKPDSRTWSEQKLITLDIYSVLELLQWKIVENIKDLIKPIQELVKGLLARSLEETVQEEEDDEDSARPALMAYGIQLGLQVLLNISEERLVDANAGTAFDVGLVAQCASEARDHGVRRVALELLRSRIESNPEGALNYILKTVEIIGGVASTSMDKYSTKLAAQTMSTASAAWIGAGHSINELVPRVIASIEGSIAPRRYTILASMIDSMPSYAAGTMASVVYHLLLQSGSREGNWGRDASRSLLAKSSVDVCIKAIAILLDMGVHDLSEDKYSYLVQVNKICTDTILKSSHAMKNIDDVEAGLLDSYDSIIGSVLVQLQKVGKTRANTSHPVLKDMDNSAYDLLLSLRNIMDSGNFMSGVIRVMSHPDMQDPVKKKALSLFSSVASGLSPMEAESPAVQQAVHDAVGSINVIIQDNSNVSEQTCQMALSALASMAKSVGGHYSDVFLQAVPTVVDLVMGADASPAVKGMSLLTISSFIEALKNSIIPMVPRIIGAILAGSKSAVANVSTGLESHDYVEVCAALKSLESLSSNLAPFLAPNVQDVLKLLLHSAITNSENDDCKALGASCRTQLATKLPSRLLLGPLAEAYNWENFEDPLSGKAHMDMLAACIIQMDPPSIASHNVTVFSLILKGLDTRRVVNTSLNMADIALVEDAAINCLLQLTLKLNEARFRPLFFRLIEWATTNPTGETTLESVCVERRVAFFGAINSLTENLRSVFTPYFKSLTDPLIRSITSNLKHSHVVSLMKIYGIRALTRCFMYDASNFLDDATFEKLMTPLVDQLNSIQNHVDISNDIVPHDRAIEASLSNFAKTELGIFAQSLCACLTHMATAVGGDGDTIWRPLNHSILMVTRSESPDVRLAALETTMSLCEAIQEEYLPFLPEALPFLSELLEDEDGRIEARTVEVLRRFEEISGEDLKQYLHSNAR